MKPIRVYLIDTEAENHGVTFVDNDLEGYYKALHCDCIDIVTRYIGKNEYDIVCDDEGLFKENPVISACDTEGNAMLVGSIFFCHHDSKGNLKGITSKEADLIRRYITTVFRRDGRIQNIVTGLSYE